jgi:hypothetical protein
MHQGRDVPTTEQALGTAAWTVTGPLCRRICRPSGRRQASGERTKRERMASETRQSRTQALAPVFQRRVRHHSAAMLAIQRACAPRQLCHTVRLLGVLRHYPDGCLPAPRRSARHQLEQADFVVAAPWTHHTQGRGATALAEGTTLSTAKRSPTRESLRRRRAHGFKAWF